MTWTQLDVGDDNGRAIVCTAKDTPDRRLLRIEAPDRLSASSLSISNDGNFSATSIIPKGCSGSRPRSDEQTQHPSTSTTATHPS